MRIQAYQPVSRLTNPQPSVPQPNNPRVDAFYRGAGATGDWMGRIDFALTGGALGLGLGAALGVALSNHPVVVMGMTGAVGIAGAIAGHDLARYASNLAGRVGASLDESNPVRGEALGRVALRLALSAAGGGLEGAAFSALVMGAGGGINYALQPS